MNNLIVKLIKTYQQYISKYTRAKCRYYPTCSNYAVDAYQTHSFFKASYFVIRRLLRCHPFSNHHFFDPVPGKSYDMDKVYQIMMTTSQKK